MGSNKTCVHEDYLTYDDISLRTWFLLFTIITLSHKIALISRVLHVSLRLMNCSLFSLTRKNVFP